MPFDVNNLKYNDDGLIPAIVQDSVTGEVLMMAYMNREAVEKTLDSGETWFWSRSRKKFWHKGETSGNTQKINDIYYDCDRDTLLIRVTQKGAACHEGYYSCFHYRIDGDGSVSVIGDRHFDPAKVYGESSEDRKGTDGDGTVKVNAAAGEKEKKQVPGAEIISSVFNTIMDRKSRLPEGSYTAELINKGRDGILKKLGEEAAEVIIAGKNGEEKEIVHEASDLIYHLMVLLASEGVGIGEIFRELERRTE
ncbi:MAG: phosphoribosyl-ATP pyrophosphatase [Peptococcaceae bacterium BICA1-7]|nr:MAG: phosphoribosyl-ATP pyrophosphatase [Peptococcaceae bacterium BICA1-7]HBV96652.1 bifunctional phosphoribosyl-AMP cyclohydrolase/phosphoribosyl-ATP diphosphatase HisIE [Desulfotomaculum sp.]